MPASVACQLETFRLVPVNRFQHHPLSEERPFASAAGAMLPKQPGRSRWRGASFVPDWDKSLWAPGPTHSQGAFSSEDGSKTPSRFRSGGLSITPLQVALSVSTPSGCPSLPEEDPLPKRWVVVADTTSVRQNFELTCLGRPGVFHNVNTRVFHNCGYRVSLLETHCENTISPAPDHGPRRGRVDVHKKDVSASPRSGRVCWPLQRAVRMRRR